MYDDAEMSSIIASEELTNERVYKFPTSQIKLKGKKSSYHDIISSLTFPECNNALRRIVPTIDLKRIGAVIEDTCFISDVHKEFYEHMIKNRFEKILEEPFLRLEEMS